MCFNIGAKLEVSSLGLRKQLFDMTATMAETTIFHTMSFSMKLGAQLQ